MIKASELIKLFQQALDEGWGYIWGTRGQIWTQSSQDRATRDMTVRHGQKWVGKRVADCSGLFVWAFRELGGDIYHGSNTMWKKYTGNRGPISGTMNIKPGTAVFTVSDGVRGHVGLYIGGGKCIEAKGTPYGVVTSDLSRWDEWGELLDVDYSGEAYEAIRVALPTLRMGSEGSAVKELQQILNTDSRYGGLKVDGVFGRDTLASVRAFQSDHSLTPDGVVGPKTWAALQQTEGDEVEGEDKLPQSPDGDSSHEREPTEAPEEPALTMAELTKRLIALEGIVYGGDDFRLPEGG